MKDREGVLAYVGGFMTHHTFTLTQTDTHYRHHLDNAQDPKARAARFSSYRTPEDTGLKDLSASRNSCVQKRVSPPRHRVVAQIGIEVVLAPCRAVPAMR